ncbi:Hypothetical predicted protein [Mytilus galloprovincialis]|uniref:Uncharacterized protein n=1 Tax=Mytilus galloprovincialis TaxID=29158 RepID=A0A8B6ELT0_MYTGA|nr:Hypothetical predicted protein [Mytilus galloprovincialis]
MDRGEPQHITVITETRNLRSQPFILSDDQISTGKHWEEWMETTCDERILEHCIQTITNQDLIKRAISKGWNLDKFVEEAGQMEDTCLQMKDMKGDTRDIVCRAEKKQQYRAGNFRQGGRSVKKTMEDKIETDSNTDISDYDEDEDYFGETIKHIMKIRKVKTIQGIRDMEKTVMVRIDDVDVKVEPDSGADVNVMDENQFVKFQSKTYGNPVLEKSKIKLSTLQNSLPIKGEFKTIIRNKTCGTETKFVVVKGKINSPPLISKSTLIELGMIQIRTDGSFVKKNQLRIPDNRPPFNSKKLAIDKGFNHYQVTPGRQIANKEVNIFRKPINKTQQITKLKKKNTKTAKQEINRRYHSNLYEEINERDRQCKEKIKGYAENRNRKMKKMAPRKTCAGGGSGHTKLWAPARQAREGRIKRTLENRDKSQETRTET